jgi:hypothetical protein
MLLLFGCIGVLIPGICTKAVPPTTIITVFAEKDIHKFSEGQE